MVWIDWRYFTDRWLARAEERDRTVDAGDRFISLWIAFNGWMRHRFGEDKPDKSQIKSVIALRDFEEVFLSLRKTDPDFGQCLDRLAGITVVNMQFKEGREDVCQYDGTFRSLIQVIYQVRCNLFHGRKNVEEDQKDFELVDLSYRILLPLFRKYLQEGHSGACLPPRL